MVTDFAALCTPFFSAALAVGRSRKAPPLDSRASLWLATCRRNPGLAQGLQLWFGALIWCSDSQARSRMDRTGVAQIFNLPYRRFVIGRVLDDCRRGEPAQPQQNAILLLRARFGPAVSSPMR
jgi:hypothetical protein